MTARKTRRRFLQTSTVVGGVALAGCLGGDDDNGDDDENGDDDGNGTEAAFASASPVCHDYTQDGQYAYVTLGPGYGDAGLLVFDVENFEIAEEFPDVPANCGTIAHPEENKMYLNGGVADTDETDPAGEWWVFDTENHEELHNEDSNGYDTHGVWFTPDGDELWMVNRDTDDGFIVDPETDEIIEEIDYVGTSPDILTISPDGQYAYVTTRGPDPQSGPHAIQGDEPGVSVIDVESREHLHTFQPDGDNDASDFHGIGLVPGDSDDDYELWAVDQGTATLYVLEPAGDGDLEIAEEVDLGEGDEETPHMVDFDSEYRYAAIPSTSGGITQIVRVDDYEIVEELDTGAGSHFAGVNPGDETILVDVIGDEKFVEIDADFEDEEFEISQELVLSDLEQFPGGE
ncbi:YncE family protein [Natronorubrum texcoconense]|uniref:40-residue YVTN family beta-propeller repeat-containing protein n=1 Tax=Natronorubrum texcoconense TaxID=1095776 RepID=A0A1G9DUY8_9EURY|nr:hypothetical protein [Natronorubrum texcoconense]SDK67660.1 hypothetical protein SAMN04515672_3635 [Natronorubrum texcoconense]